MSATIMTRRAWLVPAGLVILSLVPAIEPSVVASPKA